MKRATVDAKSEHVAVIWVQITHALLLRLREGVTLVRVIPPPVLQNQTGEVDDVGKEGETDKPDANGITRREATGMRQESESGNKTTEVAESDLPAGPNGAAQVPSH